MKQIPRPVPHEQLQEFLLSTKGGVVFVKGRRRIGKTWLLQAIATEFKGKIFRFLCKKHRRDSVFLKEVVQSWCEFYPRTRLLSIKTNVLTWKMLFDDIGLYAKKYKAKHGHPFGLIIDEIQWLSTDFEASAAIIKAAWDELAIQDSISMILCGSSTRFFSEQFGEGSVLRGIQTRAHINVLPFSLGTLRKYVVPHWSIKETIMAYMCMGGVPYYWQQIQASKGFIKAMNQACCINSSIMLDEWKEILSTEFRTDAVSSLSQMFPAMVSAEDGITQSELTLMLQINNSVASRMIDKLINYGYVLPCFIDEKRTKRGTRFILIDFYLNFYFTVLHPMEKEILRNTKSILFPTSDYIQNFTGKAFERFVFSHINIHLREHHPNLTLLKKMDLSDLNYETHLNMLTKNKDNDKTLSQIDIAIIHSKERTIRVLECKWKKKGDIQDLHDVINKKVPSKFSHLIRMNYLVVSYLPNQRMIQEAIKLNVVFLSLEDFNF